MLTCQLLISSFFTTSPNFTQIGQTLNILAYNAWLSDFWTQTPSSFAANPDLCLRKYIRLTLTWLDSLYSQAQHTRPFKNFLKTKRRLWTSKTMTDASNTRLLSNLIPFKIIQINQKIIYNNLKIEMTSNTLIFQLYCKNQRTAQHRNQHFQLFWWRRSTLSFDGHHET